MNALAARPRGQRSGDPRVCGANLRAPRAGRSATDHRMARRSADERIGMLLLEQASTDQRDVPRGCGRDLNVVCARTMRRDEDCCTRSSADRRPVRVRGRPRTARRPGGSRAFINRSHARSPPSVPARASGGLAPESAWSIVLLPACFSALKWTSAEADVAAPFIVQQPGTVDGSRARASERVESLGASSSRSRS